MKNLTTDFQKELIPTSELYDAFANTDIDKTYQRQAVAQALLKYACGYASGMTIFCACKYLRLVDDKGKLTITGKTYLYECYKL